MRGHAIVSSDYAIKVINLIYPNSLERVIAEREKQIVIAKQISKSGEQLWNTSMHEWVP